MRIIGGRLSGRRFGAPRGRQTRPTSDRVREGLASALESRRAFEDARVLDLFAGTGAFAFESLSRGAARATLVDRDPAAVQEIKKSISTLGLAEQTTVVRMNLGSDPQRVADRIAAPTAGFSLVFADAPYADIERVPALLDALTAAGSLSGGAFVVIEHPSSHAWQWTNGLASEADYRYGDTAISVGVYHEEGIK